MSKYIKVTHNKDFTVHGRTVTLPCHLEHNKPCSANGNPPRQLSKQVLVDLHW